MRNKIIGTIAARAVVAALLGSIALSLTTCSISDSSETKTGGNISVTIPAMAGWISDIATQEAGSSSAKAARAYAYASFAKLEVLNSSGTTISTVSASSSSSGSVNYIPAGKGYTIKVSVYNKAVSMSSPVVSGQTTGLTVTDGATTNATVTCLPTSATTLSGSAAVALAAQAEAWYSLDVSSGTTYYFTLTDSNFRFGLFDATGSFLASATTYSSPRGYYSYTAGFTGKLYIAVVGYQNASTENGVLTVSPSAPALNEGSVAAPIALSLNTNHDFIIGPDSNNRTSYYAIKTSAAGDYALDFPADISGSLRLSLFDNSSFSDNSATRYLAISGGALLYNLAASTSYYIRLENYLGCYIKKTGIIIDPTTLSSKEKKNEGSPSSPVQLELGQSRASTVGYHGYDNASFYKFTTGSVVDYQLKYSDIDLAEGTYSLDTLLYSDSSYRNQVGEMQSYNNSTGTLPLLLSPSQTYYIRLSNYSGVLSPINFKATLSAAVEPSFIQLPVSTDGSWTVGTNADDFASSWFKASLKPGKYFLYMDNKSEGSGKYTAYCSASAYQSDRVSAYFNDAYSMYSESTRKSITVPTGQSIVYIRVSKGRGTFALKLVQAPDSGTVVIGVE